MARKKEPDKLSLDMIECEKAGYGVHYGRWKAAQDPVKIVKPGTDLPEGWYRCEWCGTPYKPKTKRPQKYCQQYCQQSASKARAKENDHGK